MRDYTDITSTEEPETTEEATLREVKEMRGQLMVVQIALSVQMILVMVLAIRAASQ